MNRILFEGLNSSQKNSHAGKVQNDAFFEGLSQIDKYKISLNLLLDEHEILKITISERLRA